MSAKSYTRSFAGGEVAPQLYGRLDLAKTQTGLAKCLNFEVTAQGPIENRAGFEYVLKTKASTTTILIPFEYSSDQSFALEFGVGYIRFHTQGSTLLEASKAIATITQAAPGVFGVNAHGYAVGDWLYLATVGGITALTGRWGIVATVPDADHFTLTDLWGASISTAALPAYTGGGTAARVYEIASPYAEPHLFDLHYVQSADVLTIVHQDYAVRELRRLGATNWTLTAVSFLPTISGPTAPTVTTGGPGGGTATAHVYCTTALASGTLEESLQSGSSTGTIDLTVAGNYVQIVPAAVVGAVRYNVYKLTNGIYGYIGQTDATGFLDNNVSADMSKTPPLSSSPFATDAPRAVSYFEQRRVFGASGPNPQNLWLTRSGTESNMTYSIPTQDDDAITARIVAREANTVRHLVPLGDLLALTSGGVWRIAATDGGALTPATLSVKPQSYAGASNAQPVVTSDSVLYVQNRGCHIREIAYKWETQRYSAEDVSVMAPHLFELGTMSQMAYARAPTQILWVVRGDDGRLLGLTHMPEHQVKAWHQHTTQGSFRSVCSVAEGSEDGVYVIVSRAINGQAVQYIERKHSRSFATLADAFFVDSGVTYSGAAATVISGLWHLEGATVSILADGGVEPAQAVTAGTITLTAAASKVQVGLSYNCDAQTLPFASETMAAFGQGVTKNVNEVSLRVYQTSSIKAGPSFTNLKSYAQRTVADDYGTPPGMVTGMVQMKLPPQWQMDGALCVRQSDPLPITLLALTIEAAAGG